MGAISMFLFKKDSRNAYNNERINHRFVSNYKTHKLNWIMTEESATNEKGTKTQKFLFVSSFKITEENAAQINQAGRIRYNIENSFNKSEEHTSELQSH